MNQKKLVRISTMFFLGLLIAVFSFTSKPVSVDAAKKTTVTSKKQSKTKKTSKVTKQSKKQTKATKKTATKTTKKVTTKKVATKTTKKATTKKVATKTTKKATTTKKVVKKPTLTTKITNWNASSAASLAGVVDQTILEGFEELGFVVTVNKQEANKYGYSGCFSPSRQMIILKKGDTKTLLHEMGHFVDFVNNYQSSSNEFQKIYKSEKSKAKSFYNSPSYTLSSPREYFAESFSTYYSNPATLKAKCPKTYAYMEKAALSVTAKQISFIQDRYGLY